MSGCSFKPYTRVEKMFDGHWTDVGHNHIAIGENSISSYVVRKDSWQGKPLFSMPRLIEEPCEDQSSHYRKNTFIEILVSTLSFIVFIVIYVVFIVSQVVIIVYMSYLSFIIVREFLSVTKRPLRDLTNKSLYC